MSEYSGIRGTRVKYLASDPTLNTSTEGQVWYNSTSGTLKSLVQIKAWSSGGNMNTARIALGGTGTSTAGLAMGGTTGSDTAATEEYNGYSWSNGGNLNTARRFLDAAGTQTAGLAFGGYLDLTASESYNGSTWTATSPLAVGRHSLAGTGTQTAALAAGGATYTTAQSYNGTSWTAISPINTARGYSTLTGVLTAALLSGGQDPVTATSATESYNGTTWTTVNSMNTARLGLGGGGTNNTAATVFGGGTPSVTGATEQWDGTNWISVTSMTTGRQYLNGTGTETASIAFGGRTSPSTPTAATEEYVSSIDVYSPSTLPAWASGGALPTATNAIGSFGSQTAALAFNGEIPGAGGNTTQQSLSYDGTSWTATNPTGPLTTGGQGARGAGTQAQGIASSYSGGGGTPAGYTDVKEWDGTNWTAGTSHTNRCTFAQMASAGTQTATAIFGGTSESDPSPRVNTEEWNGTSWANGGNLNTGRGNSGGSGTLTSSICVGSDTSPFAIVEEYNGTSWTTATAYPSAPSSGMRSTGLTQDATLAWHLGTAATWDGAAWTTQSGLATPRTTAGGAGSVSLGLAIGGITNTTATEEFTEGSPISPTGAVASTLTTS